MSTNFPDVNNGDIIDENHVDRYTQPINNLESGATWYREATNAGNAYTVDFATDNVVSAYTKGLLVHFKASADNTGAATLAIIGPGLGGALAPIALTKKGGDALAAGDINIGQVIAAVYTEDAGATNQRFEVIGGLSSTGGGGGLTSPVAIADGGTGATTAADARTSLGAQAQDDALDEISNLAMAKGDIFVHDGTEVAKLSPGSNGQVLSADTAETTGLKWVAAGSGTQGPAGPQGEVGPADPQGLTGATGPQGEVGPAGPQGLTGATGPQGEVGPAGPQGLTGATGPQGEVGPAGPQGLTGATGLQGEVGPAGPPGPGGLGGGVDIGDFKHSFALSAPEGWLECDGSILSQAAYPDLHDKIGQAYLGNPYVTSNVFSVPSTGQYFGLGRLKQVNGIWFYFSGRTIATAPTYHTSTDGVTWTQRTSGCPINSQIYDVTYGAGLYVMSCTGSTSVYTSTDGYTSWTARTTTSTSYPNCLQWNGAMFVAGGASQTNTILTSTNGTSWTLNTGPTSTTVQNAIWFNSLWIIAVGAGEIYSSPTATSSTWTQRQTARSGASNPCFATDGTSLLCAYNNGYAVSTNGTTWTANIGPWVLGAYFDFATYSAGLGKWFVSESNGNLWESSNLTSWQLVADLGPAGENMFSLAAIPGSSELLFPLMQTSACTIKKLSLTLDSGTQFKLPDVAPDSEGRPCYIKAEV